MNFFRGAFQNLWLTVVGVVLIIGLIGTFAYEHRGRGALKDRPIDIDRSIQLAHQRLIQMLEPDGRFIYREDLNPKRNIKDQYNAIRHAGAIYSFAMYEDIFPSEENRQAIKLASRYLIENFLLKIRTGKDSIFAILTTEDNDDDTNPPVAHLGGAGLGLVALLSAEKLAPGTTAPETLISIGRFLLYMQKDDGSFYSRYKDSSVGRDDQSPSLYYPGESILALVMLYEWSHDAKWLEAAEKGLHYLAQTRIAVHDAPPDNWALIATAKILPLQASLKALTPDEILKHAELVAKKDMDGQVMDPDNEIYGCYSEDGRTTPTATRLEGLLSLYPLLDSGRAELKMAMAKSIEAGIAFLARSQVLSGPFAGAIPKGVLKKAISHRTEVRIDYIQHAMSAFIRYKTLAGELHPQDPGSHSL